jgi:maleylpyruvate isomerase
MLALHGYWRSGAAWRVRIALALKGLDWRSVPHDLRIGAQEDPAYRAINPQGLVPALNTGHAVLTQSLAIIEWLDEAYPQVPILPADPLHRAHVRAIALAIACDTHPLANLRVQQALRRDLGADDAQVAAWLTRWIGGGLDAVAALVARHGGLYAVGDTPTLADCCLIPQIYGARRFGIDPARWPALVAIETRLLALPAIAATHPDQQADATP